MSNKNDIFNYTNSSLFNHNQLKLNPVKFWIYVILIIPAIISTVFSLFHLLSNRTMRCALHNHVLIIFLFICLVSQLTVHPWTLHYYRQKGIWKRSPLFCSIWKFVEWGLYFTQTMLFAWATIERHILVFYENWVSTRLKRILVHYLPLVLITVYCFVYYTHVIFYPPCQNTFNYALMICFESCIMNYKVLYIFDVVVHQVFPHSIIIVCNIGLLIRIHHNKIRAGLSLRWQRHWRMIIQLLFVSAIYFIFALPLTVVNILHLRGTSPDIFTRFTQNAIFLYHFSSLICPIGFAWFSSNLKEQRQKLLRLFKCARRAVAPMA